MAHLKTCLPQRKGFESIKNLRTLYHSNIKSANNKPLFHQLPCVCVTSQNRNYGSNNSGSKNTSKKSHYMTAAVTALGATFASYVWWKRENKKLGLTLPRPLGQVLASSGVDPGVTRPGLPTYTEEDVAKHDSLDKGIWVTYKNGVYNITEYVEMHPGGKKILMAAGKSIEPFWNLYSVHKMEEVFEQLEAFRIGNIKYTPASKEALDANDPYAKEPERSALLIPSSKKPFNAEPPQTLLTEKFLTPNDLFFVRNHLPVPEVDEKDYSLELGLDKGKECLCLDDLKKKFTKKAITAVTQCAGNRRSEMVAIKPVKGLNWGSAAISNAKWAGVTLDDLLLHHGVDIDKVKSKYIVFEGMDKQPDNSPYGASIPVELAQTLKKDIIIAYEMNNQPIPRDHGYPVRVVIPGVVGARQVKWLNKIYFSREESTSHWQRRDYKGFNSSIDWHNVDFDASVSISQLPVISAICEPEPETVLDDAEEVTVKGYAWSGGGRGIIRVDVSADGGKTWVEAKLKKNNQSLYKMWAWTLWEVDIALPKGVKTTQLVCKAVDVSYNVQPDSVEGIWNLRGVLSNAWHRVNVKVPAE